MTTTTVVICDSCGDECAPRMEHRGWPIRYHSGPYSKPRDEELHGCIDCVVPHYDDVLRRVNHFAVNDGVVEYIHLSDEWVEREEAVENPYIKDAVEFLEDDLLTSQ